MVLRSSADPGRQSCSSGQADYCCSGRWCCPPQDRTNHPCSTSNYTNSGRRNQAADRHGRATQFESGKYHPSTGREDRRLGRQRHPLPDVRIDRSRVRRRGQNAQRRRGAVHRRRKNRSANGGQRRAIYLAPLHPCSRRGLGSAHRDGAGRRERIISHSEFDPRPEARRL
jgi:hypothetical protein